MQALFFVVVTGKYGIMLIDIIPVLICVRAEWGQMSEANRTHLWTENVRRICLFLALTVEQTGNKRDDWVIRGRGHVSDSIGWKL